MSADLDNFLKNDEVIRRTYEDVKVLATTIRNIRGGLIKVGANFVGFDRATFMNINLNASC